MAEPKQKQHRAACRTRRSTQQISAKILVKCQQCKEMIPAHQVCPECGYYKGKEIISKIKAKK